MRWTTKNGMAPFVELDGFKYFCLQDQLTAYYYIARRPIVKTEIHSFRSYKELYRSLMHGRRVQRDETGGTWDEDKYWREIMAMTWGDFRNLREYRMGDRPIVVDMAEKKWREFVPDEVVSPTFRTLREAKEWAEFFVRPAGEQLKLEL